MSGKDIIEQLHDDARRLRVARKLPEGTLTWEWISRVRDDFKVFKEGNALALTTIAKKLGAGFSAPVLSSFLTLRSNHEYIGDVDRIARGLNQFMEQYVRAQDSPKPSGFVETRVAKRTLTLIQNAIELRAIGVIYGPAGVGKTMTLQAAHAIFSGSILIRSRSTTRTASGLARLLADAIKINTSSKTLYIIQTRLIEMLKGTDRPILIDEAHHLEMPALEFLRDLHDECGIPIILVGTVDIERRVSDTQQWYGQFASRTALRYDIAEGVGANGGGGKKARQLFTQEDIIAVFHSDKLRLADDAVVLLAQLANHLGLGCLRLCRQVAFVAAKTSNGQQVTSEMLLKVLRQMHGQVHMATRVEQVIQDLEAVA